MQDATSHFFILLFKEAFGKCFGIELRSPLSETECKHFSNAILEETGLVIGAKSLKNYSFYVLNREDARQENPSFATLDTLARYVLKAPYTDELKRKEKEGHFPYWFQYRNANADPITKGTAPISDKKRLRPSKAVRSIVFIIAAVIVCLLAVIYFFSEKQSRHFVENFSNLQEDSLKNKGWFLKAEEKAWWAKRGAFPAHFTLYTLCGDSWTDSIHSPVIKNLLLRKITSNCFIAEIHLDSFVPMRRWQQAGILLLEDTALSGKSLRLSIAYNDFFGGFDKPKEIIVQAISADGSSASNPEEIVHSPLFSIEPHQDSLVANNLHKSALRIEKRGDHFRFLSATGQTGNFAFKEVLNKTLVLQPKYIGIFALEGFVTDTNYIPARFKYFSLTDIPCN